MSSVEVGELLYEYSCKLTGMTEYGVSFQALMSGDAAGHDARVSDALRALAPQVDVIVLAQASMARVVVPDAWTAHPR